MITFPEPELIVPPAVMTKSSAVMVMAWLAVTSPPDPPIVNVPAASGVLSSALRISVPVPLAVTTALMLMLLPARSTKLTSVLPVEVAISNVLLTVMSLVA